MARARRIESAGVVDRATRAALARALFGPRRGRRCAGPRPAWTCFLVSKMAERRRACGPEACGSARARDIRRRGRSARAGDRHQRASAARRPPRGHRRHRDVAGDGREDDRPSRAARHPDARARPASGTRRAGRGARRVDRALDAARRQEADIELALELRREARRPIHDDREPVTHSTDQRAESGGLPLSSLLATPARCSHRATCSGRLGANARRGAPRRSPPRSPVL